MKTPVIFLASGRGSNFEALLEAEQRGELEMEIRAVISDRAEALVLSKAKKAQIPAHVVPFPENSAGSLEFRREQFSRELLACAGQYSPRFLVLGGFMRILPVQVIRHFQDNKLYARIVNIHPSLLPGFPGKDSYKQAFDYGAKVTGVTVHLVDEKMDHGPICAQEAFRIDDCRSEAEVQARGLEIEHRLFAKTLRWVLPENFDVIESSRRICVRSS